MVLKRLGYNFCVCKVADYSMVNTAADYFFIEKTEDENSLVCLEEDTPLNAAEKEYGWKGFKIEGILDFSLIGILSKISGILAENQIGIFAVSTFNTDYIFVKEENFDRAMLCLEKEGYEIK